MTRLAGEEALPRWLRGGWLVRLLGLGVLLFLLAFAVIWSVAGVALGILFWHQRNEPTVGVFLGALLVVWTVVPTTSVWLALTRKGPRAVLESRLHRWNGRLFLACFAIAWFAGLAGLLHQGNVHGFLLLSAFTAFPLLMFIAHVSYRRTVSEGPPTLPEGGLVLTHEGGGRYALEGVGTLRVEGDWQRASARAGGASFRFAGSSPWSFRLNATANDAAGSLTGGYQHRGRVLRWGGRELQLRRASLWPTLGWRALVAGRKRYVLADGEWTLAEVDQEIGRADRPVNIEPDDSIALEPGLLLFVAFLVGWLDMRDRNNDGA